MRPLSADVCIHSIAFPILDHVSAPLLSPCCRNLSWRITDDPEVGVVYDGKVVKTTDFGALVNFMPGNDGLVHISKLADARVAKTTDVVKDGDQVKALLVGFGDRGKMKLSMKRVNKKTGEIVPTNEKLSLNEDSEREAG